MIEKLYPTKENDSAYAIPYESLYALGKRGIIYDIDNTLVMHGAPADDRSRELFDKLRYIGFKTVLLSNNKEKRVKSFCDDVVGATYIHKANKPFKKSYLKAMEMMGVTPKETVCIGDQLFTDIWGAKASGIYSILVDQIDKKEEIQIIIKRRFEHIVLFFYKKYLKKNHLLNYTSVSR